MYFLAFSGQQPCKPGKMFHLEQDRETWVTERGTLRGAHSGENQGAWSPSEAVSLPHRGPFHALNLPVDTAGTVVGLLFYSFISITPSLPSQGSFMLFRE